MERGAQNARTHTHTDMHVHAIALCLQRDSDVDSSTGLASAGRATGGPVKRETIHVNNCPLKIAKHSQIEIRALEALTADSVKN